MLHVSNRSMVVHQVVCTGKLQANMLIYTNLKSRSSLLCYITRLIARHLIWNAAATPTAIPSASFGMMAPSPLYTDPTIGILFTIPVDRNTKAVPAGMKIASRCDVRVIAKWTKKERAKWRKASRLKVSRPMKKLPFSMTSSTSSCDGGL